MRGIPFEAVIDPKYPILSLFLNTGFKNLNCNDVPDGKTVILLKFFI